MEKANTIFKSVPTCAGREMKCKVAWKMLKKREAMRGLETFHLNGEARGLSPFPASKPATSTLLLKGLGLPGPDTCISLSSGGGKGRVSLAFILLLEELYQACRFSLWNDFFQSLL